MRKILSSALVGLLLVVSTPAFAEPSADDRAVARSLFDQGRELVRQGNYAEACPKLEESQKIDTGVGTLFNLADCYEHLGRFASAWAAFSEAADLARRAGQADREVIARDRASAMIPKLSKLRIRVARPLPPGFELRYDDKPLTTAILDTDLPVDPGEHRLRATATGKTPAETRVKVETDSGIATVDLPPLVDAPQAEPPVGPMPPPPEPAPPPEGGRSWQKPAALGLGAGALVALGVGAVFGLKASSQWSDAQKTCPANRCDDAGYKAWDDAKSSATLGTVLFVAGGVLAAAAVVLFVTAPSGSSRSTSASASARTWRMP